MSLVTDEIKSRLNIVDLIGEYVQLQKAGASWKARCPFHNEKTPSFTVSEEKQFWHCFGCGKGGDAFAFLMEIEGLDFKEALENLAQRTGVNLADYQFKTGSGDGKKKLFEILELATKFYEKQLWTGKDGKRALAYLKNRGLQDALIKEFRLGYAPVGWENILKFLQSRGYGTEDILKTGLIIKKEERGSFYDRFRNRIVFPISDITGRVLGFSARAMPGDDEAQAKYINTPETEIYHKGKVLYGIDKAKNEIKKADGALLVEGNMDVIASHQVGLKNAVAVSGTALTPEQLKLIKRYSDNIKMFFDMDEAGQKASERSCMLAFENEMNVFVVQISEGKDAADMVKNNAKEFLTAVEKALPAMEYFLQQELSGKNKNDIVKKKKAVNSLAVLLNSFSNKMEKEYWIRETADRLDISEEILFGIMNKMSQNRFVGNERISQKSSEMIDSDAIDVLEKDRLRKIQIEIMGILLTDKDVWKSIATEKKDEIEKNFSNRKIVDIIIKKGEESGFEFEKLMDILNDERQKSFLRALYLEKIKKEEDDVVNEEKFAEVEQYFSELKKENNKKKVAEIVKKIKECEKEGDKKEVEILAQELMRISSLD